MVGKYWLRALRFSAALAATALSAEIAYAQDAALVAAAQREGKVVWYTTVNVTQLVRPMVEAFRRKYNVDVEFVPGGSRDVATRMVNEAQARSIQGDVWDGSTAFAVIGPAGLAEPYFSQSARAYPESLRSADGMWVAQYIQVITQAINTELVKPTEVPRSYEDLLDPKWKGKMAWNADTGPTSPEGFIGNILLSMGREKGMDFLRRLSKQEIANVPANQRAILDQTIQGQYAISILTENHHAAISAAKGAPVKWVPLPPSIVSFSRIGLIKGAPHPNAAKLLIEFVLSPEGQAIYREADYLPANPQVAAKEPGLRPEVGKFPVTVISLELATENKDEWSKVYKDLFQ